jgi:hypothetical protein
MVQRSNPSTGKNFLHTSTPVLEATQSPVKLVLGLFPRVKGLGCGTDHPPPSNAKIKKIHQFPLWAITACSRVNITFVNNYFQSELILREFYLEE